MAVPVRQTAIWQEGSAADFKTGHVIKRFEDGNGKSLLGFDAICCAPRSPNHPSGSCWSVMKKVTAAADIVTAYELCRHGG
ncbi:hypothetical protein KUV26_07760 [Leisingera daeponensis]|uniref:Uncharacterized protein n=2 Tax=Leisingera TaxID=191028 RepID=A0ABS7NDP6_9RHOB|nr:hypothetical protein [Leisingera daeponensis]MBY6139332.1 hypothetical protein [Leisingera daeponensis]